MMSVLACICFALGIAVGIILVPAAISELIGSVRRNLLPFNPVVQETCWLCHRVLGDEVRLYHLAKSTHRIICQKCADQKQHSPHVRHYQEAIGSES